MEAEKTIRMEMAVTPKEVLQYKTATDKFLCPLSANIYKI